MSRLPDDEMRDRYGAYVASPGIGSLAQQLAGERAKVRRLGAELRAVRDVIRESVGVAGWHLNGEIAAWDEFGWPGDIDDALAEAQEAAE
jgi:hypothetical protein